MHTHSVHRTVYAFLASCLAVCCASGCTSQAPGSGSPGDRGKQLSGSPIRVERDGTTLEVVTDQGERLAVPNTPGETVVGDHLIIVDASGEATLVRTPKAVNAEIARLPTVYYRSDTHEEILFDGHQGNPVRHPETGIVCWLALYCKNPQCSTDGEPFYFELPGHPIPGESPAEARARSSSDVALPGGGQPCPHCGQTALERYETADVAQRRQSLGDELDASRAARRIVRAGR